MSETNQIMAALRPPEHRVERGCESCGQFDDHPRHGHTDAAGVEHLKHLDCCAADGCPTGTCGPQLKGSGGAKGLALVDHIQAIHAEGAES